MVIAASRPVKMLAQALLNADVRAKRGRPTEPRAFTGELSNRFWLQPVNGWYALDIGDRLKIEK